MGTIQIDGSTPKLTIGNATAEDALIVFDGNAQDFHIGLDDTADDLVIGVGSTLGTTTAIAIDENANTTFSGTVTVGVDDAGHDVKFFGDTASAYMLWDTSTDDLVLAGAAGIDLAGNIDVDGTANLDVVDIDGAVDMASTLQVDGAITTSDGMIITTADNTDTLTLKSTDADANTGPVLLLHRDSGSPADGDSVGVLEFQADNDAGELTRFARIDNQISDASNGSEDALMFITTMVAGSERSRLTLQPTEAVFNEDGVDLDFRVEGDGDDDLFLVNGGTDRIGINAGATPEAKLHIIAAGASEPAAYFEQNSANAEMLLINNSRADDGSEISLKFNRADAAQGAIGTTGNGLNFWTGSSLSEQVRITSDGHLLGGGTLVDGVYNDASGSGGATLNEGGYITCARSNAQVLWINRIDGDGDLVGFFEDGSQEGTVSISGSTTSYNAFCGSHWSRLADNSKPTILRGTVMESIATMMDWYQAKFTAPAVIENEITVTPERIKKQAISLPEGKSVGDSIKHTYDVDGVEYDAEIIKENNERLPMCKVSDTSESKAVYGVFMAWDDADDGQDGDVNDMYVAALGAFVVRINSGETVAIGDYLQSNGDGTAKVQADDILRASTIAKVTSTEKTHIHADDSYCVPCTLHCG